MIDFANHQDKIIFSQEYEKLIQDAVEAVIKYEDFDKPYEVSVTITDNIEIRKINKDFRNIDKETDVLSFPMLHFEGGFCCNKEVELGFNDVNPENGSVILGDMVLSIEKAISQAEEFQHPIEREISFLTVHSILHLLGYDHENEDDKKLMRKKEEDILCELGISR